MLGALVVVVYTLFFLGISAAWHARSYEKNLVEILLHLDAPERGGCGREGKGDHLRIVG